MWLSLSDGVFFFGSGGVTVMKIIDLRDKPASFAYRTELLSGATRVGYVIETAEEIKALLNKPKKKVMKE